MMTLFAFAATVGIIIAIARYNESDKLFWQLLIAFAGSYAAASAIAAISEEKQDKVVMIEQAPTQVLGTVPSLNEILAGIEFSAAKREKSPKPVSKDSLVSQNNTILSKVHAHPRGQPHWCMYFDDS